MSDATDIDGLTVGLTVLARDLAALRDMVTERMSADLGRALGMCETLAGRVERLEAIRHGGAYKMTGNAVSGDDRDRLRDSRNDWQARAMANEADRDTWKARAESAEAFAVKLEAERDAMRDRLRACTEALLDIAHPKMETGLSPHAIALRCLSASVTR